MAGFLLVSLRPKNTPTYSGSSESNLVVTGTQIVE